MARSRAPIRNLPPVAESALSPPVRVTADDDALTVAAAVADDPIRLGFLIQDVARLRRMVYARRMKPFGINRTQWLILAYLSRRDGMTQTQLADTLEQGKASTGEQVGALDRHGWVVRHADAIDGRAKRVYLSPSVRPLIQKMARIELEISSELRADSGDKDTCSLTAALSRMRRSLKRLLDATHVDGS